MYKEWLFEPLDTLFFRGGLSIDAGEPGWLESVFPPTPITMQGIVRSILLLTYCKDTKKFGTGKCNDCPERNNCQLPAVRKSVTIDWTMRENARAQIRIIVKRILRKYGYPPDKQEKATQTVLEQAEVLCKDWVDGDKKHEGIGVV